MYRLKRIWLKLRSHAGMYIFAWLQFVVVMYILSIEIGILRDTYDTSYFIEDYDEDMYMYANVGRTIINLGDYSNEYIYQFIEATEKLDGVKGVGYTNVLWTYEMLGGNGTKQVIYLSDVMADISYKGITGKWLTEAEWSEKYINVVVGNEFGNIYELGDTFTIEASAGGKTHICRIVGIFEEGCDIISLNMGGSEKVLSQSYGSGFEIYTDDDRILEGIDVADYGYTMVNMILLLDNENSIEELAKYGNIYPLEYMENCNDDYFSFCVNMVFTDYGILLFVVLFGSFATIYLILSKGMYTSGVHSLLGMTRFRMAIENLMIHMGVYISAAITVYVAYSNRKQDLFMFVDYSWNSWHTVFLVALGVITSFITFVTSICMLQKKPKDIMSIAKSMEG